MHRVPSLPIDQHQCNAMHALGQKRSERKCRRLRWLRRDNSGYDHPVTHAFGTASRRELTRRFGCRCRRHCRRQCILDGVAIQVDFLQQNTALFKQCREAYNAFTRTAPAIRRAVNGFSEPSEFRQAIDFRRTVGVRWPTALLLERNTRSITQRERCKRKGAERSCGELPRHHSTRLISSA